MSLSVFAMVLLSACLHVLWNSWVKTSSDKVSCAFLTTLTGTLIALLLFVLSRVLSPGSLAPSVLALAVLSGLIEALYIIVLFAAYDRVDLSVAYPLSRGLAPLVSILPGALLLHDTLGLAQCGGVALIVSGVSCVAWSAIKQARNLPAVRRGLALALITGTLIAAYHVVDRRAMTLNPAPAPLEYFFLMHLALMVFISIWVFMAASRRRRAFREWHGNPRAIVLVGVFSVVAYALIITALAHGNVTVVAATRNIGIVLSTVVGALALHEKVTPTRVIGALLVTVGVVCLVWLGP